MVAPSSATFHCCIVQDYGTWGACNNQYGSTVLRAVSQQLAVLTRWILRWILYFSLKSNIGTKVEHSDLVLSIVRLDNVPYLPLYKSKANHFTYVFAVV